MAKKKSALDFGLSNFELAKSLPGEINPKLSDMMKDGLSKIVPMGQQFREALEPVYAELSRVTGELTKANERTERAEERADIAERQNKKGFWITVAVAIIAIIVPLIQGWYNDSKNRAKEQQLEKLSSIVEQQGLRIKILEGEVSKPKTLPLPVKNPLGSNKAVGSKKP